MSRRSFMGLSGVSAAAVVFGVGTAGPFTEKVLAQSLIPDDPFSLGVASGDPEPDGVVIWTRLAPDPLAEDGRGGMPGRRVPVRWEVADDENFRRVVQRGTEFARPELAHSVHAEVAGLSPAREYFYRFRVGRETSPTGRTKTAPEAGASPDRLTFAFASCQQYEHGYFNAYANMVDEDLDVVFHLGDYIYEYGPNVYRSPGGNVRAHEGPETVTLSDYRNRLAQYKTDSDMQAAHAAFPWVVTFDDHEVDNNWADETSERNEDPAVFLRRRAAAFKAYYEHMPLRKTSVPRGPDVQIYRRLTYGDLAEFNVFDTRQYRDDQAAGDGRDAPNPSSLDPSRTITGDQQERWLFEGLSSSRSRWNVMAQQVFFAQRDFRPGDGRLYNMDAWDGYVGSRDRILGFIEERGIRNPVVLTGDVHNNWAADLLSDFDDPDSKVLGSEFVGTSITSGGDGADTSPTNEAVVAENPHIKFFQGQRGYVRCTLTPEEYRTDYRVVPYVSEPGARAYTRASFVVQDGQPGLQPAGENEAPRRVQRRQSSEAVVSDAESIRAQEEADRKGRDSRGRALGRGRDRGRGRRARPGRGSRRR